MTAFTGSTDCPPARLAATRGGLHRVAEHVLAGALYAASGEIGLIPSPGGFRTPPFGPDGRFLAVDGAELVVGDAATTRRTAAPTSAARAGSVSMRVISRRIHSSNAARSSDPSGLILSSSALTKASTRRAMEAPSTQPTSRPPCSRRPTSAAWPQAPAPPLIRPGRTPRPDRGHARRDGVPLVGVPPVRVPARRRALHRTGAGRRSVTEPGAGD